jgi:glycosyltransferase involved in cell wall biosynthesis
MIGKSLVNENYDRKHPWNHDLNRIHELAHNDKNIIRLGFLETDDLVAIYNMATLSVLPSLYEGFGLPILEAQACGCPVVASHEGSLKEVLGSSGLVIDAYDLKSIASGIESVFKDKDLREDLIKKGYENVKKYSWKKTAKETVESYKRAIA